MINQGVKRCLVSAVLFSAGAVTCLADPGWMNWTALPPLTLQGGVAGPFTGISGNVLIAAGGTDFPVAEGEDRWAVSKVWHDEACVLPLSEGAVWQSGFRLSRPVAHGASVSTPEGVVCIGGNDEKSVFSRVFILCFENGQLREIELPDLPRPCASGSAVLIGNTIYLAGGQSSSDPRSAMTNFWSLDLSLQASGGDSFRWIELPAWPGPERAFNLTLAQHNGFETCVYVMSGRRMLPDGRAEALRDVWEFSPSRKTWKRRADSPVPLMAATGTAVGQSHLFVISGDDGALMDRVNELKDAHPGFPRQAWAFHTITDTWTGAGEIPCNQVSTSAVRNGDRLLLLSGEIRPRVRTPHCWSIMFSPLFSSSGMLDGGRPD